MVSLSSYPAAALADDPTDLLPEAEPVTEAGNLTPEAVRRTALAACEAGITVLPAREDGSKRPDVESWTLYQKLLPDRGQVEGWYRRDRRGVVFVTGRVSGNLECLEFDDPATEAAYREAAVLAGMDELIARIDAGYAERTPGGGIHWLYRCDEIAGNTKLARRPKRPDEMQHEHDTTKVLIETRGEGGLIVAAPSHGGVHPTGRPYELISGGVDAIVTITVVEREALWNLARSFDQLRDKRAKPVTDPTPGTPGARPGDVFNERTTWDEILEPLGWTRLFERAGETYWTRPGKTSGISATTNFQGSDLLYVFSSSTPLEPFRGYSKFAAYAQLNHDGDFKAAARALADLGHGTLGLAAFKLTDYGNAERLVQRHGRDLRYSEKLGGWLVWNASRWEPDETGAVERLAKETARSIYGEAEREQDTQQREEIVKHARSTESERRLKALVTLAQTEPGIHVRADAFDADPYLFNVLNGTLDLRTGELRRPRRDDRITKLAPVAFDPAATCPTWEAFLGRIFEGNDGLIRFVQKAVGYALTGLTTEQVLFLMHGYGANGKSTFVEAIRALLGEYARQADYTTFLQRDRDSGPRNDVADLRGARLVSAVEVGDGRRLDEMLVKQLTGGDTIKARHLYREYFEFTPTFTIFLAANHKPVIRGEDEGIWRRIRLIPFAVTIPSEERDRGLLDRLRAELPGILNGALAGCLAWQADGLTAPAEVEAATLAYRGEMDALTDFLEGWCELADGATATSSAIYMAYQGWCKEAGIRWPLSMAKLREKLESRGLTCRKTNGLMTWAGIRVERLI